MPADHSVWQSLAGRQVVGLRAVHLSQYHSLRDAKGHPMSRTLWYDARHM